MKRLPGNVRTNKLKSLSEKHKPRSAYEREIERL